MRSVYCRKAHILWLSSIVLLLHFSFVTARNPQVIPSPQNLQGRVQNHVSSLNDRSPERDLSATICEKAATIVADHFDATKKKASHNEYNLPTIRFHSMSACRASDRVLQELVPIMKKYSNSTRLHLEFIGSGDVQTGLKSLNGPAELVGDYYSLCAQQNLWSGAGTEMEYLKFLAFVECVAGRKNPRLLPLESCTYIAGSVGTISHCLDEGPYMLEDSFKISRDEGIKKSPTMFLEWPQSKLTHLTMPQAYCGGHSAEAMEEALCAALIYEAASLSKLAARGKRSNATSGGDEWLAWQTMAADTLRNASQACDEVGAPTHSDTCSETQMNGAMLVIFYLLPGVLIMFVLCFGVSSFSRIFRLGIAQQPAAGFQRFASQLPVLGADIAPAPNGASGQGLPSFLINSIPTSTPQGMGLSDGEGGLCHCSICVDEIDATATVFKLKCCHVFHQDCLREWLEKKNECPVCRQPAWSEDVACEMAL